MRCRRLLLESGRIWSEDYRIAVFSVSRAASLARGVPKAAGRAECAVRASQAVRFVVAWTIPDITPAS